MLRFCTMDFGRRLDEALLRPWQAAAESFDRIDRKHCGAFLIVRMKVRTMVLSARFDEHSNHDPEKARQLRHLRNCIPFVLQPTVDSVAAPPAPLPVARPLRLGTIALPARSDAIRAAATRRVSGRR